MTSDYLIKLLTEKNISERQIDRFAYSTDASSLEGNASLIIWPKTREQVHQIILYAKRNKRDLVARGYGTDIDGSTVPNNSIIIDFSKMNKILEASKSRLYVILQPGVILSKLNRLLETRNLNFPIKPLSDKVSTIAGLISTNATSGSLRYPLPSLISELEIIDGSGKLIIVKGSKIKDFIGSRGTLGVITKIKLKLTEIPKISYNIYEFETTQELLDKTKRLKENEDLLSLFFISRIASKLTSQEEKYYLIAQYEGMQGLITEKLEIANTEKLIEDLYPKLCDKKHIYLEKCDLDENLLKGILYFEEQKIPSFGYIGTGEILFTLQNKQKSKEVFSHLQSIGSSLNSIGLIKKDFVKDSIKENILKLKTQYDPENILNVNKVI
ncbi:hypothetical protein CL618_00890 [archaeon]|nr:hypothetical protein [archaeon]